MQSDGRTRQGERESHMNGREASSKYRTPQSHLKPAAMYLYTTQTHSVHILSLSPPFCPSISKRETTFLMVLRNSRAPPVELKRSNFNFKIAPFHIYTKSYHQLSGI